MERAGRAVLGALRPGRRRGGGELEKASQGISARLHNVWPIPPGYSASFGEWRFIEDVGPPP